MPKKIHSISSNGERMAVIETDVKYIKDRVQCVEHKIDYFIDGVDKKYATKEELNEVRNNIFNHSKESREWVRWAFPIAITIFQIVIAYIVLSK